MIAELLRDQRVRFLIAGTAAAGINWLAGFPLAAVLPFWAAVSLATAIGMVFGFFAYKHFVFPGSARSTARQVRDFVAVNLFGALATVLAATALRDAPPWPEEWLFVVTPLAHGFGIAAGAVINYLGHSRLTFRAE